nr:hypothetical protein [Tanacetum cinerariifolium]
MLKSFEIFSEFDEPVSDEEIVSFIKELGYKGDIGSVTEINNRDSSAKRQENMPYLKFIKAIIQHFISKDKSISMRNIMFMHTVRDDSLLGTLKFVAKSEDTQVYRALFLEVMINQKIQNSHSYKTYLAFATRTTTPKKARKWKKLASPSKKQTLVITEEHAKKPTARSQPTSVQIRDTPGVFVSKKKAPTKVERNKGIELLSEAASLEEILMKRAIKRSKRETHLHHAGGSGDGAGLESEVPDEPKGKSIDTHEGTSLKPGVLDMSKVDSLDSEYEY